MLPCFVLAYLFTLLKYTCIGPFEGQRIIAGAPPPLPLHASKSNCRLLFSPSTTSRLPSNSPSYYAAVWSQILTSPSFCLLSDRHRRRTSRLSSPPDPPCSAGLCVYTVASSFVKVSNFGRQ